jgi:hypothetical protein
MIPKNLSLRTAGVVSLLVCLVLLFAAPSYAVSPDLVISQVFGGGGNSGTPAPPYKYDFIELYNRGLAPVSLNGLSVQYASASGTGNFGGTSTQITVLPNVTLAPGQYYLIQEASGGTAGAALPTPDWIPTSAINLSGSAGKVALVNSTSSLGCNGGSTPCTPAQLALIIDLVGYGSANFYEGSAAPGLSNATAALRQGGGCTDTDTNSSDFVATTPAPRNSASAAHYCSGPTDPSGAGAANPATLDIGNTTLLTVTVSPGTNPPSTGLAVTVNLAAIGGSATQAFYDDGSNGDATAGDNVFSFRATIPSGSTEGAKSLAFTITDAQARTGSGTIALTLNPPPPPYFAIHAIQGDGSRSPLEGQRVATSGIVVGVLTSGSRGFYLEAPDAEQDSDPATSEGIFVYTGSAPAVAVGDAVQVAGTVSEYKASGVYFPLTEIGGTGLTLTVTDHGRTLPSVVEIAPDPAGAADQLERYEGMLVHIANLQAVGPSGISGTATNGIFYVASSTLSRPFREPGIAAGAPELGFPADTPRWNGNPERLKVDTSSCTTKATVFVGDTIAEIAGPLGSTGDYTVYACPTIVSPQPAASPLPDRGQREFTAATFNMLNFTNNAARIAKASLAVRNIMRLPDIIGVEEVNTQATLDALVAQINADAEAAGQGTPGYAATLLAPSGTQNVGLLYRTDRVTDVSVVEVGRDATFIDPKDGSVDPLNDRPPLVMTAKLIPPVGQPFPVTVIVSHLRSLIDVDTAGGTGDYARLKRKLGAEYLADLIAQHQANGENVISVGDYNAYEFNDGYVDVLGAVIGKPVPDAQVLLASEDLVNPDLTDLVTTLLPAQRYSYVENGNAQDIDHIVVTGGLLTRPSHLEVAHNNADFPEVLGNDAARPERVSDHDMPVAYFTFPPPTADLVTTITAGSAPLSGAVHSYTITVTNQGPDAADNVTLLDPLPAHTTFSSLSYPSGWICTTPAAGSGGQVSCTAASLAARDSAQFILNVTIDCGTSNGAVIVNSAGVTSDTVEANPGDESAAVTSTVSNPAPVIAALAVDQPLLGPPNHKMIGVLLTYDVSDNCGSPALALNVTSNQPVNGTGDGDTAPDWQLVDDHHVLLRAERAPSSAAGRTYTITVTATDSAGNSSAAPVTVRVPR